MSWLPEKYATVGATIRLKRGEQWINGWKIVSVFDRIEDKLIENKAHNSKDIWKATSGSYPRGKK